MREGWRWFGPDAGVPLDDVRQAGATDIVTALHQVPIGTVWTDAAVAERKNLIETTPPGRSPLIWSVVESVPIPDAVKRVGKAAKSDIETWIASMQAVARGGVKIICYNFMRWWIGAAPTSTTRRRPARRRCASTSRNSPCSSCASSSVRVPSATTARPSSRRREPCSSR